MSRNPWIASLADAFINNALSALGAGARALENPGEFLRDDLPPGTDGLTLWIQDRNRRACRRHARNEAAGLYSNLGALRRPRYGHCRPYLDSINEGPEEDGDYAPPFTGGQCTIRYRVDVPYSRINAVTGVVINSASPWYVFNGPILGLVVCNNGTCGIPGLPSAWTGAYVISGSLSSNNEAGGGNKVVLGNKRYIAVAASDTSELVRLEASIGGVSAYDSGQSDNCGNLPSEYRPPTYPPNLPPLPPPDVAPPGGDGDDDIEVDPDGNWRFCENGDCTPWFTPGGAGAPADPGGEEDGDPQETNPNDPNNPNEISGCVEDGNVLVGLKINVLEYPTTYQGSGDIFYRVGWVWMGPNANQLDMTVDGGALRDGQFVFPDGPDCTCYTVRANPEFRLSVQAFSRPREENNNN